MRYNYDKKMGCLVSDVSNAENCLEMIFAIGGDYDGCNTVEGLKKLIDELVEYSLEARNFLKEKKYTDEDTAEEDEKSYEAALKIAEESKNG